MSLGDEPAYPISCNECSHNGCEPNIKCTVARAGLTKRELCAIELTRGLFSNPTILSPAQLKSAGHHEKIRALAIIQADALLIELADTPNNES